MKIRLLSSKAWTRPAFLLLSCMLFFQSTAQNISISGKVTDESGENLIGVTILEKGTSNGTITDIEGDFSLNVSQGATLVVSYTGFVPQEIVVDARTVYNITMVPDITELEEIVVMGYGTQEKKEITGSVSSVDGEALSKTKTSSLDQALQGKAAGVFVTSNSGQPGGGVSVRVRGFGGINNSEPLYVVDGVPIQGNANNDRSNPLAAINPNDIQSIEVLKDAASAAIYGARGANGVVLITTKSGESGVSKITYNTFMGVQSLINSVELLNATQFAENYNASELAADPNAVAAFESPSSLGAGTDWLDAVFRDAMMQEHQLSFSGGSAKTNYYMSLNYFDQDGIVENSSFERYSFRLNTNTEVNSWLNAGNTLTISNSISNGFNSNRGGEGGVLANALAYSPTIPLRNADGSFAGPSADDPIAFNPRKNPLGQLLNEIDEQKQLRVLGSVYAEAAIVEGLKFRTNFSVNYGGSDTFGFAPIISYGTVVSDESNVTRNRSDLTTWIWENVLTYEKQVGDHGFTLLAGYSAQEDRFFSSNASANYTDNEIRVVSTSANNFNISQTVVPNSIISQFGRVNYNYADKYLLTANIRRDGSSRFGPNERYGVFPSFSLGWRLTEESFFPQNNIFSDIKIRGGYGEVGFNAISNFVFLGTIGANRNYPFGGNDGTVTIGAAPSTVANPDVRWETVKQTNIGADFELFESRVGFSIDYFIKERSDMLLQVPVSSLSGINRGGANTGLATVFQNTGSLENSGLEFSASYRKATGDFKYSVSANLTTYNNEVTSLGPIEDGIPGQTYRGTFTTFTEVGAPVGNFYGFIVDGIFQNQAEVDAANAVDGDDTTPFQSEGTAPGDFRYRDISGPDGVPDGVITDDDRTVIGSPIPDFTYGLNISAGYKNFDLSLSIQGVSGNEIYNVNRSISENSSTAFNKSTAVLGAWNGEGTSNSVPRAVLGDPNSNSRLSSAFIEDGSFMRLRNIELGYTLPASTFGNAVKSLRIYVGARNLLTITDYSGFDPEIGNIGGSNLGAGVDNDVFPQAKTFLAGLNVTF